MTPVGVKVLPSFSRTGLFVYHPPSGSGGSHCICTGWLLTPARTQLLISLPAVSQFVSHTPISNVGSHSFPGGLVLVHHHGRNVSFSPICFQVKLFHAPIQIGGTVSGGLYIQAHPAHGK